MQSVYMYSLHINIYYEHYNNLWLVLFLCVIYGICIAVKSEISNNLCVDSSNRFGFIPLIDTIQQNANVAYVVC